MTEFKEIASGLRFPEGPIAMPDGSVILVEIARGTLSRVTPDGKIHVVAELGGGPNSEAFDGRRLNGPNDIVFDAQVGFWFTDLGKTREYDSDRGAVYYASADGSSISQAIFPLERPNGCGLSPDEKTLYVVETPTARVWAFDLGGPGRIKDANGPYRGEKGRVIAGLGGYQMFDSLALDAEGNVCVATLITGAVSTITPKGELLEQVKFPDMMVTNVCFGGKGLRTAYVTLSGTGKLVSMPWKRAGLALNFLNK